MARQIGLMGGTFDPVHNGHLSIARSFVECDLIDELWILLTPEPPHKKTDVLTDFSSRYQMLQKAFDDMDQVVISDVENDLPQPAYTLNTIRHLKSTYPPHTFYLCIGEDSLRDFHTWHQYKEIVNETDLIVAKRPGIEIDTVDTQILGCTHFVDHQPVDISSTEIRDRVAEGRPIVDLVPKQVEAFIRTKGLYRER